MEADLEHFNTWITLAVSIIFPLVGWIFNTLITNKINEGNKKDEQIEAQQKLDKELFFKKFDEMKEQYVRKDLYDQAMAFHQKEVDSKFLNLIATMEKQFNSLETDVKDVKTDVKEVKDLINEKFKKGV